MYAVLETGGKQYKVAKDDVIKVEKLEGQAGDNIKLDRILMVGDDKSQKIGTPLVAGTVVTAEILEQIRDKKILVFKKKRRQGYRRTQGHRQSLTVLRITDIGDGKKTAAKKAPAAKKEAPAPVKKAPAKKAAAKKTTAKKAAPAKAAAKPKATKTKTTKAKTTKKETK